MRNRLSIIGLILLLFAVASQANWRSKARSGDKLYETGEYNEALVKYLEALSENGDSTLIKFGLGNVFQGQEKYQEAGQSFQSSLSHPDSLMRADALYNIGNALVGAQMYQEAVDAYKTALKINPGQADYLHNLQLAEYLMDNPQEQQQSQGEDDSQEQNQQDQQQDQQQQEEQNQQQDQGQQEQSQEEEDQTEQQDQQQAQPQEMSPEDAERLLNALLSDEQQVQENLKKQQAGEAPRGKDW